MSNYTKIGLAILFAMMLVFTNCVSAGRTIGEKDTSMLPILTWLFQIIQKIYGKIYDWWLEHFGIPLPDWSHMGEHYVNIKGG